MVGPFEKIMGTEMTQWTLEVEERAKLPRLLGELKNFE